MSGGFVLTGPGTSPRQLVRELWQSRRLVGVLARKDFFVRYRRTRLGLVWSVALPLVQAVVLAAVFSSLLKGGSRSADVPYAVFVFSGLVPWTYFSTAFTAAATSVVDGTSLAQRIYFPRMVLPLVAVTTALYPLTATLLVLVGLLVVLGPGVGLAFLWVLPGAALVVLVAFGMGLLFSAAQVYLRDLRFAVTAGMTLLFYLTPVIYAPGRVPSDLRPLVRSLPVAGPVELFRKAVGERADLAWPVVASLLWALVVGAAGFVLHCRRDRVLTDQL